MPNIGMQELIVIGVVLMLFFGPSQLPKLGRSIGNSIKEFRAAGKVLRGEDEDDKA